MVLPIKGFSRQTPAGSMPRPGPAPSPKHAENVSGSPDRLLQLGVFPQIWSLCGVIGGRGVGTRAGFLGREGAEGELVGRLTSLQWQPFKPLTQPVPQPVCQAQTQRPHSLLPTPRKPCE